jgi:hypothetical protein
MTKYSSREAFNLRLQQLAEVRKPLVKAGTTNGTLINYTRGADGVAYGIIKENHNYFLKKGGKKQSPDSSDFAYIGGLENITNYQYKSINEAEKQRNLILIDIKSANNFKVNKTSSKMYLNESIVDDEIDQAKAEIPDLDAASAEQSSDMGGGDINPEIPDLGDNDTIPTIGDTGGNEGGLDAPMGADTVPTGEEGAPDMGGEEGIPDMGGEEGADDDVNTQIVKALGKLTNIIRKTETTPVETKGYLNTFISAFKDKLPDVEIEDRKEMANKLIKVIDGSESDLESSMPDEPVDEESCTECGGFGGFADSNGYSKEDFINSDDDEKANLISRYKTGEEDGENQNDDETIGLFVNDKIAESLSNDYGHEKYVSEVLKPQIMKMSESTEEDKEIKINELSWGGIKNAANSIGTGIKNAASSVGSGAVKDFGKNVTQGVKDIGAGMKQGYNKGVQNDKVTELTKLADELKLKIDALNAATVKAGGQPIDATKVISILQAKLGDSVPTNIANNKGATAAWSNRNAANLNTLKVKEDVDEMANPLAKNGTITTIAKVSTDKAIMGESLPVDAGNVEVKPNMIQEDENEDDENIETTDDNETTDSTFDVENITDDEPETPMMGFAPEAQNLGVGGLATSNASLDINVDANAKTLNIKLNEAIKALSEISTGLANSAVDSAYGRFDNNDPIGTTKLHNQLNTFINYVNPQIKKALNALGIDVYKDSKEVTLEVPEKGLAGEKVVIKVNPKGYNVSYGLVEDIDQSLLRKVQYYVKLIQKDLSTGNNDNDPNMNNTKTLGLNESEVKLRKYIRTRLEESAGLRKPMLSESAKSETLKKLDKTIDEQFTLYKSIISRKKK